LGLTTKSDLVARDAELLREMAARHRLSVSMTVTTVDADLARALEPMAPGPELRLRAVAALAEAGIRVGVYASPLLPGITDSEESLTRVAEAARAHGATAFGGHPVFLQPCAQKVFFPFLEERFPHLARGYREQFEQNAFLRGPYSDRLAERVREIRARVGLASRPVEDEPVWSDPQLTLDFE
jgi:DNA repair photolyase